MASDRTEVAHEIASAIEDLIDAKERLWRADALDFSDDDAPGERSAALANLDETRRRLRGVLRGAL